MTEGMELAKSLDESLGKILKTETLLEAAGGDLPVPAEISRKVADLGLQGVAVEEVKGGLGLSLADRVRLAAVVGRRLVPAAIRDEAFGTAPAIAAAAEDSTVAINLLERLLDGNLVSAVALAPRDGSDPLTLVPPEAEVMVEIGVEEVRVLDLGDGLEITALEGLDPGQGLSRAQLNDAEPIVSYAGEPAARVRREYELALICEAFGSGERTLELSADFADEREQFGRPISSFQAVSHLLAEMKLGLETSRAGIGRMVDLDREEAATDAELERWRATLAHSVPAAARRACESAIQVHGGIGFSWELGLHLHYRRILADQFLLGGPSATSELIGSTYLDRRKNQ